MNVNGMKGTSVAEIMLIKFSSNSSERMEINERKVNEGREFCFFFAVCHFDSLFLSVFDATLMQNSYRQVSMSEAMMNGYSPNRNGPPHVTIPPPSAYPLRVKYIEFCSEWQCMCISMNLFT